MLRRRAALTLGGSAAALALLVTGCATDEPERASGSATTGERASASPGDETPSGSPTPSVTPSTPASASPDQSSSPTADGSGSASPAQPVTPSPTSPSSSAGTAGPADQRALPSRLLPPAAVPGFNPQFRWRGAGIRRSEASEPFGTCHRFAMTSIGAERVVVREYAPAQGPATDTAGHLVAEFADEQTARRAFEVLKSWRGQCEDLLQEYDRVKVGTLHGVPVDGGQVDGVQADGVQAGWYLLTYGPAGSAASGSADDGYFDAQGLALVGPRVAVLEMRLRGQDYNYPPGREPMVQAVRAAAVRLAS